MSNEKSKRDSKYVLTIQKLYGREEIFEIPSKSILSYWLSKQIQSNDDVKIKKIRVAPKIKCKYGQEDVDIELNIEDLWKMVDENVKAEQAKAKQAKAKLTEAKEKLSVIGALFNIALKYNDLLKKAVDLENKVKPYEAYFVKIMDTIIPFAGCRDKESFENLKSTIRTCLDQLYLIKKDLTEVPNLDQKKSYALYELSSNFINKNMDEMCQLQKDFEESIEELKKQCAPLEQKKCYKKILKKELWDIVKAIDSLREDATLDADKCIEIGNNLYKIFDEKQIDDLEFHWVDYQEFFSRSVKHMYVKGVAYPALYQCNTGEWKEKSPFNETGNPREGWNETMLFYGGRK